MDRRQLIARCIRAVTDADPHVDPWCLADAVMEAWAKDHPELEPIDEDAVFAVAADMPKASEPS